MYGQLRYYAMTTPLTALGSALVSVHNFPETLRNYTISSTPSVSEYITLTVRRIDDGAGSAAFEIMRDMVYNLPITPIVLDNLLYYLVGLLDHPAREHRILEAGRVAGIKLLAAV